VYRRPCGPSWTTGGRLGVITGSGTPAGPAWALTCQVSAMNGTWVNNDRPRRKSTIPMTSA
jgi:hypothetical protein